MKTFLFWWKTLNNLILKNKVLSPVDSCLFCGRYGLSKVLPPSTAYIEKLILKKGKGHLDIRSHPAPPASGIYKKKYAFNGYVIRILKIK